MAGTANPQVGYESVAYMLDGCLASLTDVNSKVDPSCPIYLLDKRTPSCLETD
jgi:hypothetical protein